MIVESFKAQLMRIAALNRKRVAQVVIQTVLDAAESLIEKSPTGQWEDWSDISKEQHPYPPYQPGMFKGNWVYSTGAPSAAFPGTISEDGSASYDRIRPVEPFAVHYLVNNTEYAHIMETGVHPSFEDWYLHSPNQAGVLSNTIIELPGMVQKTAAGVV